jgi:fructose-bisphosphate aldolase class II
MIESTRKIFETAALEGGFVPAFNVFNLETVQSAFIASEKVQRPLIVAFGESYLPYAELRDIAALVLPRAQEHPFPVALHLDHCRDIAVIRQALDHGFTSVMYDGSHLPFNKNMEGTRLAKELASRYGATLEAELGGMNPEDGSQGQPQPFTDPKQAELFVSETGVDSLAVAVGNAHGLYKGVPQLDFARLGHIFEKTGVPLVLHGSSGIPMADIIHAAKLGVRKINVNTEVAMAGAKAAWQHYSENARLEKLCGASKSAMADVMAKYYM